MTWHSIIPESIHFSKKGKKFERSNVNISDQVYSLSSPRTRGFFIRSLSPHPPSSHFSSDYLTNVERDPLVEGIYEVDGMEVRGGGEDFFLRARSTSALPKALAEFRKNATAVRFLVWHPLEAQGYTKNELRKKKVTGP